MKQAMTTRMLAFWAALCVSLFSASASAGYSPYPDRSVLTSSEFGTKYFIAGGARFEIPASDVSYYGFLFFPLRFTVAQTSIDSITEIPRDNTLIRDHTDSPVYVVISGRKWHITTIAELDQWGGDSSVLPVPADSLDGERLAYANTHAMIQERTTLPVYVSVSISLFPVNTLADLNYYGGTAAVKTVPLGSLYDTYLGPQCGTIVREISSSTAYQLGISLDGTTYAKSASTLPINGVVPNGALSGIPTVTSPMRDCIN